MKMSEVFNLPVFTDWKHASVREADSNDVANFDIDKPEQAKALTLAINNHDKLVEALEAALKYIGECPCDPDIYPEQLEAWNRLQSLNAQDLLKQAKGE